MSLLPDVTQGSLDLGGDINFREAGAPGAPVMVMLHGLGGSSENWLSVMPALSARGYRVLAPDMIGHGRTPPASRPFTIEGNLELIDAFVRASSAGPVTLVGNSLGGLLAMAYATAHPSMVASLVLVAPAVPRFGRPLLESIAARLFTPAITHVGPQFLRARARRYRPREWVEQSFGLCARDPSVISRDVVEAHRALARERVQMEHAVPAFVGTSTSMLRTLGGRKVDHIVRAVSAPTLIVGGAHDRLVPRSALERVRALRPDWSMHIFEDCAHIPQLEDPAGFVEVLSGWLGPVSDVFGEPGSAGVTDPEPSAS